MSRWDMDYFLSTPCGPADESVAYAKRHGQQMEAIQKRWQEHAAYWNSQPVRTYRDGTRHSWTADDFGRYYEAVGA